MANKIPYSPKKVIVTWGSITFVGFMDGTFVEVDADQDAITKHVGADGRASLALNADEGAAFTVTLAQTSETNDLLTALLPNRKKNRVPTFDFHVTDLNGTTIAHADIAWIKKVAKIEFGDKILGRKWMFDCERADILPGGGG